MALALAVHCQRRAQTELQYTMPSPSSSSLAVLKPQLSSSKTFTVPSFHWPWCGSILRQHFQIFYRQLSQGLLQPWQTVSFTPEPIPHSPSHERLLQKTDTKQGKALPLDKRLNISSDKEIEAALLLPILFTSSCG